MSICLDLIFGVLFCFVLFCYFEAGSAHVAQAGLENLSPALVLQVSAIVITEIKFLGQKIEWK
jgi:hypothetical protein